MFATSLLPLPPPATSLLPSLSQQPVESFQQPHPHYPQTRRKHLNRLNTPLTSLTHDERLVASRKLAIAMYGYSWLKPAGCIKTMLGRREEELEREEVERQLREVELQERMAMEQDEHDRREELRRQAEGGEVEGVGDRNLDDEVPEAVEDHDDNSSGDEDDQEAEEGVEEDMDGDLDDDIPNAAEQESSWVYDTRRESDTESEDDRNDGNNGGEEPSTNPRLPRSVQAQRDTRRNFAGQDGAVATEAIVNAMLDEDELGEFDNQHDLEDETPDMDMDRDLDADDIDPDMDMDMSANLSDEVPSASASPGWEHTDSELEESEMDISLLPPHPDSASRNPGTTHEEMRRVSGNRMLPPSLPPHSQSRAPQSQRRPQRRPPTTTAPRHNLRTMMHTPTSEDEVSALISTGGTSALGTNTIAIASGGGAGSSGNNTDPQSPNRRNWLNPAGARRNLFGGFRGGLGANSTANSTTASASTSANSSQTQQTRTAISSARLMATGVSSGGLFTPSPRQVVGAGAGSDNDDEDSQVPEQARSRTRSGRLLGGLQVGRRGRRREGA